MMEGRKPREKCGVFGVYGPGLNVARLTYYGIFALQHRGQESAGIAILDDNKIHVQKGMGLVSEVFGNSDLDRLQGRAAIGHVRYSTTGASQLVNAQPLVFRYAGGMLGLAHNGNITNTHELYQRLTSSGAIFQSTTDSEIIVNLLARYSQASISMEEALIRCMQDLEGAYSLVILTEKNLFAVRDAHGFRPLCLGVLNGNYVVVSESCALDTIGASFLRDVAPGEIVTINEHGLTSIQGVSSRRRAHCIFEYIYFARPDSNIDGFNVKRVRREMGRRLAQEYPVKADLVIPVPDSGTSAALGYAEASGISFEEGLMKNRYVGRTFIQPCQEMRDIGVRLKLNPVRDLLAGKRIVLVDDSLVRGTTSKKIVGMLRECGAREIHLCLSSPPVVHACYYGIDTSNEKELLAAQMSLEEIRQRITVDGLHYLSLNSLLDIFDSKKDSFCTACYSGDYPVALESADLDSTQKLEF